MIDETCQMIFNMRVYLQENFDIFNFFFTPYEMKTLNMLDKGQFARSFNYSFLGEA